MRKLLAAGFLATLAIGTAFARPDSIYEAFIGNHAFGRQFFGSQELQGHVVVWANVSTSCEICKATLGSLAKLQDKYRKKGLYVIATCVDKEATVAIVQSLAKAKGVNYTITTFGKLRGDDSTQVPRVFLFDTAGKYLQEGSLEKLTERIDETVKNAPHPATRGRKFENADVKRVADGLKSGRDFSWALDEIQTLGAEVNAPPEMKPGETPDPQVQQERQKKGQELQYLAEGILAEGHRMVQEAKRLESDSPHLVMAAYEDLKSQFKKYPPGVAADEKLKELKADKFFQEECKAAKLCVEVEALCGSLEVGGKVDLTTDKAKKVLTQIQAKLKELKAKYSESRFTQRALQAIGAVGVPE